MFFSILLFIFYKFFVIHICSGKFVPKIWISSNWLKFGTEVDYHILISTLMFIFSKFFSFIFSLGKFCPRKWEVRQIKWNLVQGYIVYAYFDFNVYFFKILFIHNFFWQICSQNVKFPKLTEMLCFDVYFFTVLIIHIFGLIWSHKLKFSILTEFWCSVALLYV